MAGPANDLNISQAGYVVFDGTSTFVGRTFQAGSGITLTNASGVAGNTTISATGGGGGLSDINVQTGTSPVTPTGGAITFNGATVAAGTHPVRTDGTATSTMALEVQLSQAIASTNATNVGLAAFNSNAFTVDANGFVGLVGGGTATISFNVQANTAPGTNPVVPTSSGAVTINGSVVANHGVVLRTNSLAANTFNVETQYATTAASSTPTASGVAHFNSADFTVDANGFVSFSGTGVGETITGDTGGPLSPVLGNWNIIGGTNVTTSGSGNTLTINATSAGGFTWNDVTTSTRTLVASNGYVTDNAGGVTYTLPASGTFGDEIWITGKSGSWEVTQNAGQQILIGSGSSTAGVTGSVSSTNVGDSMLLLCTTAGASTIWRALNTIGNLTIS